MSFNFIVQKIDKNSAEEAANLVVAVFNEREPLAHLNSSDPKEFAEYILYLSHKCAEESLGFVARDVNSNKIIGAILSSDLSETVNSEGSNSEVHNNPIAALIDSLNSAYFTRGELEENTYLNIKFIATDSNFKGKGVVMELISTCIKEAKVKGFKYAQAEATGNISQHIFINKLGFDEKASIKYSEFDVDGEKPFSSITEHEGIKLLIKSI
ncbi:GNAT family N-acetyltransferase [Marinobacterium jannaschii]|uniref:GNAT family N-acetyltransferase n=1 Tax=Marinobacterium jannaschii TaxID=64970 RepID=UPI0004816BAD|nr:GNAT family N-acetyltransferase [Marinobacterium jannaschii]